MTVIFFSPPLRKLCQRRSGKPRPSASCKNISTRLKNFGGNNLASCFKLGGLLYEEREAPHNPFFSQDFCKELTQGPPPSDATPPTSGRWGQHAAEECCYISSSLFDAPEMCCAGQMKGLGALQQLLLTSLNRAVARGGLAFGWYLWVHLQKHKSTFCRQRCCFCFYREMIHVFASHQRATKLFFMSTANVFGLSVQPLHVQM